MTERYAHERYTHERTLRRLLQRRRVHAVGQGACRPAKGSRDAYARAEERGCWQTRITPDSRRSSRRRRASSSPPSNAEGQPYIQHRGGPAGFLRVLDDQTIGFADFAGNRQYITQGNLADNPKAHLFLIDYAHRRRVKIWGEARVVEGDAALTAQLMPEAYKARPEQVMLFTVSAWDANCPQHIPQRFEAADVAAALADAIGGSKRWRRRSSNCARRQTPSSSLEA